MTGRSATRLAWSLAALTVALAVKLKLADSLVGKDDRLAQTDGMLTFEVNDDGIGFDPAASSRGSGLQGIADRLAALGGALDVRSTPGDGTTVSGRLPVATAVGEAP